MVFTFFSLENNETQHLRILLASESRKPYKLKILTQAISWVYAYALCCKHWQEHISGL